MPWLRTLATFVLVVGCQRDNATSGAQKNTVPGAEAADNIIEAPPGFVYPSDVLPTAASDLHLITERHVVGVDARGFRQITALPKGFSTFATTFDKHGNLWLLTADELFQISATGIGPRIRAPADAGQLARFAVFDQANVAVHNYRSVYRLRHGQWTRNDESDLGVDVASLAYDDSGRLFAMGTSKMASVAPQGTWQTSALPADTNDVALRGNQSVVVATDDAIIVGTPKAWRSHPREASCMYGEVLAIKPTIIVRCDKHAVDILSENRVSRVALSPKTTWPVVAADEQGRLYTANEGMLSIRDGTTWVTYAYGSEPAIQSPIGQVVARGDGPVALPRPRDVRTVEVRGRLLKRGRGLGKVALELCPDPSVLTRKGQSPCEGQQPRFTTTTAASGRFRFRGVPRAPMGLILREAKTGQWRKAYGRGTKGPLCCINGDRTVALGNLEMDPFAP